MIFALPTSTGGTLLAYQIDEWAPGGDSRIWVKIPEIKPSSEGNTSITMWWGNENAVSAFPDYVSNGESGRHTPPFGVWTTRKDHRLPTHLQTGTMDKRLKLPPLRSVYSAHPSNFPMEEQMVSKSRHLPISTLGPVLPVPCG